MLVTSWVVFLVSIFPQGGISLKMLRVSVPQYTLKGESVELICEFDLQGDILYSVSWYKDHDEFYRYVPKGRPTQHIYRIDGINVDRLSSDAQKVVIRNVPIRSSGMYRCEVSAEAPAFSSVHGESRMNIIELPQEGPKIGGKEKTYHVGEEMNLNCTSARSFPPARLQWYVNDKLVGPDYETVLQQHDLMTTVAGLRFQVGPEHFHQGRLKVRCVATISTPVSPTGPTIVPMFHFSEYQHLSASKSPPNLDYNKEALFFIKANTNPVSSSISLVVGLLIPLTLLCS